MSSIIKQIEDELLTEPTLNKSLDVGDSVAIHYKIKEEGKERVQVFQGVVIQIRGKNRNKTFTVRKISASQIGVERIFPYSSPLINKIDILKKGKVRRSKIFYLRKLKGKSMKIKEKRTFTNTKLEKKSSLKKDNMPIESKEDFSKKEKNKTEQVTPKQTEPTHTEKENKETQSKAETTKEAKKEKDTTNK